MNSPTLPNPIPPPFFPYLNHNQQILPIHNPTNWSAPRLLHRFLPIPAKREYIYLHNGLMLTISFFTDMIKQPIALKEFSIAFL